MDVLGSSSRVRWTLDAKTPPIWREMEWIEIRQLFERSLEWIRHPRRQTKRTKANDTGACRRLNVRDVEQRTSRCHKRMARESQGQADGRREQCETSWSSIPIQLASSSGCIRTSHASRPHRYKKKRTFRLDDGQRFPPEGGHY